MFVLYFKMSRGHNNIIYGRIPIFYTRIDFIEMFIMSLDFVAVKNNENMSKGMKNRTH